MEEKSIGWLDAPGGKKVQRGRKGNEVAHRAYLAENADGLSKAFFFPARRNEGLAIEGALTAELQETSGGRAGWSEQRF